jgi:hypothetical protein
VFWGNSHLLKKSPYYLLALLKDHQEKGAGGIILEDIQESLPRADEIITVILSEFNKIYLNSG